MKFGAKLPELHTVTCSALYGSVPACASIYSAPAVSIVHASARLCHSSSIFATSATLFASSFQVRSIWHTNVVMPRAWPFRL